MVSESRFIRDVQYIQTVYTLGAKNCVERMEQTVGTYTADTKFEIGSLRDC